MKNREILEQIKLIYEIIKQNPNMRFEEYLEFEDLKLKLIAGLDKRQMI